MTTNPERDKQRRHLQSDPVQATSSSQQGIGKSALPSNASVPLVGTSGPLIDDPSNLYNSYKESEEVPSAPLGPYPIIVNLSELQNLIDSSGRKD